MRRSLRILIAAALLAPASFTALGAAPAGASLLGVVSKAGVAVCWRTSDYRYAKQLMRAERLWNEVAGARRVMHESEGCIPNFDISVNLTSKRTDVQGITYDGDAGYRGQMIFYKAALDKWPECRKWITLHEVGHALGLQHDPKFKTIMHESCPAGWKKPVAKPTTRDIAQFRRVWANWPRGVETDLELASAE